MFNILFSFLLICSVCVAGQHSFKKGTIISDDEISNVCDRFLLPMFKVANVQGKPTANIVVEKDINAAATLNGTFFFFTGFITFCKNASEFAGVLAHEVTHVKAAHPVIGQINAEKAAAPGFLTMALGGILAIASGDPQVLIAGLGGGASIMQRGLLKYSREQEYSADAGALDILTKLKWSTSGLKTFLESMHKKFNVKGLDPYALTHPLDTDRINLVKTYLNEHSNAHKIPEDLENAFLRMKGKVAGFTEEPSKVLRTYPLSNKTVEARYARLIAYYRLQDETKFAKEMDALLADYPDDSYFLELKGQFQLERGKPDLAIANFEKARTKRKNTEGLDLLYAQAIIQKGKDFKKAIDLVLPHVQKNPDNIWGWRLLATAYGKNNQLPEASGCLAEEAFLKNDFDAALKHAQRAAKAPTASIKERAQTLIEEINIAKKKQTQRD
ncbi:MAG: Beta-barrel assembly-enhancing protease [Holosporales bacterium]